MAYEGELLHAGGTLTIDLGRATVIAVSGSGPNFCGHLMLHAQSNMGGYYFHVATGDQYAGIHGYPRYMNEDGFQRYLSENQKSVLRRVPMPIPDPAAARTKLESLMSERWTWGVLPNNCVSFVEEVIAAGGGTWASASNCPSVATAPTIINRISEFLNRLDSEIYRIYRVPRL